jgi:Na+/H+ antiporter NhaD/arsenite permease-like protein
MIILAVTIVLFMIQRPLNISSELIALSAAATALAWVQPDIRKVLSRIDWPVLFFFVGLFVIVGGLEAAGVFEPVAEALSGISQSNPRLLGVVIIWVVAGLSALVDNVPVTIAMISLLSQLEATGVDVSALWWAIVFGAGFGGNATNIGSGANILIVSISRKTSTPITARLWSRTGLPVAIATCIAGSILFVLFFPWLGR